LYESTATNLVTGDTNGVSDMFMYDRVSATTTRVSVSSSATQANGLSDDGAISGDGSTVSFESDATNLVTGDTNAKGDVFVRTIASGLTVRGSVTNAGAQGNNLGGDPSLSYDGKKLGFASTATNLVSADTNNRSDIFVRDLVAGTTVRFSVSTSGVQGNDTSQDPWLTADGGTVAFASNATNLVASDTNSASDIFVRGLAMGPG
jgi:Tol biopolymer transport system component